MLKDTPDPVKTEFLGCMKPIPTGITIKENDKIKMGKMKVHWNIGKTTTRNLYKKK